MSGPKGRGNSLVWLVWCKSPKSPTVWSGSGLALAQPVERNLSTLNVKQTHIDAGKGPVKQVKWSRTSPKRNMQHQHGWPRGPSRNIQCSLSSSIPIAIPHLHTFGRPSTHPSIHLILFQPVPSTTHPSTFPRPPPDHLCRGQTSLSHRNELADPLLFFSASAPPGRPICLGLVFGIGDVARSDWLLEYLSDHSQTNSPHPHHLESSSCTDGSVPLHHHTTNTLMSRSYSNTPSPYS